MSDKVFEFTGSRDYILRELTAKVEEKIKQECTPQIADFVLSELRRLIPTRCVGVTFELNFPASAPTELRDQICRQIVAAVRDYEKKWADKHLSLLAEHAGVLAELGKLKTRHRTTT